MSRFLLLGVVVGTIAFSQPAGADPFLSGYADNPFTSTRVNWLVYTDDAPDNPRPKEGELTYIYWEELPGGGAFELYSISLYDYFGFELGELTTIDYIPGTGTNPTGVGAQSWAFSGVVDSRTASLYVNSPGGPGPITQTSASCDPIICEPIAGRAVGPMAEEELPGDYLGNGSVGQDDYSRWRSTYGATGPLYFLPADGNHDGVVDAADYSVWRDNLGNVAGAAATVPEPSAWTTLAAMIVVLAMQVRKLRFRVHNC